MNERPKVTVVIPTYHDWDRLRQCLTSVASQSYDSSLTEIIVVNNDPEDTCPLKLLPANARCISAEESGSYAARNVGVIAASGDIIAFTDADCTPDQDWIEQGVNTLEKFGSDSFVGGAVELQACDPESPNRWELFDLFFGFDQHRYAQNGYFATANLFVYSSIFRRIGFFNSNLYSGGDMEFGKRATTFGLKAIFEPNAVVKHPARADRALLRKKYRRIIGGRVALRHDRGQSLLPLLARTIAPPVRAFARLCRRRQYPLSPIQRLQVLRVLITDVWLVQVVEIVKLVLFRSAAYERE